MKRRRKSSSPEPNPLLTMMPVKEEDEPSSRQVQLITASHLGLPDGWSVEKRPRLSGSHVDKYYIEPNTGLKFRSLVAVQRYLTDGHIETRTRREKQGSQCTMQSFRRSSSFKLPDGWEIEEKPRNSYSGHIDKPRGDYCTDALVWSHMYVHSALCIYSADVIFKSQDYKFYIEPGTKKRFRSLISVERHLTEENEHTPLQALIPAQNNRSKQSSFPKKSISGETGRPSELNIGSPPPKVNWVLAGPGGNMWKPFLDDSRVADSVKQKWLEIFKSSI